jgi:hypothetical protein
MAPGELLCSASSYRCRISETAPPSRKELRVELPEQLEEASVVAAVGLPGGLRSGLDGDENVGMVRAGNNFVFLPTEQYALWAMGFVPRPLPVILEEARRAHLTEAAQLADALFEAELWVALHGRETDDRQALERLRLQLTSIGLGEGDKGRFRLGNAALEPYVELDIATYALVMMSNSTASLWDLATEAAAELGRSPDELVRRIVPILPTLVQSGAAVLDLAR